MATATTSAVGHLYRQFSKKKKTKKKQQHRDDDPVAAAVAEVAEVVEVQAEPLAEEAPAASSSLSSCSSASAPAIASDPRSAATARDLRVRPALTADVEEAPPWLVAENFVSEHIAREHVSVVPEPDHADPSQEPLEDVPPPSVAEGPTPDLPDDPFVSSRASVST